MISDYVVVDLETTGLSAKNDQIIEIGAVKIRNHIVAEQMECLVNSHCRIPERIVELTGITEEMSAQGEERDEAVPKLLDFLDGEILVGQNISFDYGFLKQWAVNHKRPLSLKACDTLKIARNLLPPEQPKNLEALCVYFGIERNRAHRALDDAIETWQVFEKLAQIAEGREEWQKLFEPSLQTYQAKKQTPATRPQCERLRAYMEKHQITDTIEWENLTRSEASRMMDKYILKYGR